MDIHSKPIQQRIEWLIGHASRHSSSFCSPEQYLARERYLAEHPTDIVVLKCMDGRINIPVATNTPPGIIMPIRNLGGMFNLGWPHLGEVLANHVQDIVTTGRRVLMLITYHFSKGDPHRGCAGFCYDTEAAIAHTCAIKAQVEHVFGTGHATVYPIVCGFETDEDAIILHGNNGDTLEVAKLTEKDENTLGRRLEALFPDMPQRVSSDLLPLLIGNMQHVTEIRHIQRTLDIEHREWMICLGRGFDFLHIPNLALIIGPYSPDLADPIRKAAGIIQSNMAAGRIPDDGFLLLASVPYKEIGVDRARAELKSRFLSQFAAEVIRREFKDLAGRMYERTAVLDWRSRELELVSAD
ncbi:hypothetical protein SCT_3112 [Sulfuricella sp. T08]|uniref:carboxysome shell carbonic anhydrase domain-containg protein n=1 Tax=Sulfuricella sp. T08 TaxID=1632857 RepID=UPI0006179BD0|nr:carboxysome shell carbonic anhydrase domain-containg protein [Sulfuricella sp. T08]GAO37676.1 hypothetical protein SCT_3112 [Sulfuricella sp. T08]